MPNSPWTETGSSISLVPSTTTIGSDPENVNYLSNQDKINLMAQYTSELATKTSLDTLASTLSVSATAYDNAVAAISTALINAGAPSNWATTWPDGTTSGPWPGIQTSLSGLWATIATQRTTLQSTISATQAAVSAASVQPHIVAWAYASKPALPSSTYPSGYYAITSDYRTVQVNSAGTAWVDILISANGLFGTLDAGSINVINLNASNITTGTLNADNVAVTNLNASNITTGTLSATKVLFADGTALTTASRVLTSAVVPTSSLSLASATYTYTKIPGFGWTVTTASSSDVYNVFASILSQTQSTQTNVVALIVDGVLTNPYQAASIPGSSAAQAYFASITGLSAGTHTIAFYAKTSGSSTTDNVGNAGSYAICQRIF